MSVCDNGTTVKIRPGQDADKARLCDPPLEADMANYSKNIQGF